MAAQRPNPTWRAWCRGEPARRRPAAFYFAPCAAVWSPSESDLRQGLAPVTLAELRQFRREGAVVDALSQDGFSLALMDAIAREVTLPLDHGEIRAIKTPAYDQARRRSG